MVICPAFTETQILPEGHESVVVTCRDEWMDEFRKELETHKPQQT